jgi:hypothetical protein
MLMLYDLFDIPEETSSSVLASMPSAFTIVTLSVAESADWSKVVSFGEQYASVLCWWAVLAAQGRQDEMMFTSLFSLVLRMLNYGSIFNFSSVDESFLALEERRSWRQEAESISVPPWKKTRLTVWFRRILRSGILVLCW